MFDLLSVDTLQDLAFWLSKWGGCVHRWYLTNYALDAHETTTTQPTMYSHTVHGIRCIRGESGDHLGGEGGGGEGGGSLNLSTISLPENSL